jgi:alpha-galactosidase
MLNRERFPHGIRALADDVHAKHMKFGLWCEIEGLGERAHLNVVHPEFPALRAGAPMGYVCMGNPQAQDWAYETLSRLITEYDCDWIKLDFNVDPGAGCNRTDHGHGAGDGLYEHVQGYYRLLERLQQRFPDVVLENCSSGGLRIDLGILRRTHLTFLSDPDWPVHDLQIFWGATTLIAPDTCLHWSFCEWDGNSHYPPQTFNPRDPNLQLHQLDTYNRMSMLGLYGQSQKLPELPAWVKARLIEHTRIYKDHVRRFVRDADLYRLTMQPRRDGSGDRWCAFQYSLPDQHLLFVFRLPGAEAERAIRLTGLQPDREYRIEGFEGERRNPMLGFDLMDTGIVFNDLPEEGSALLRVF